MLTGRTSSQGSGAGQNTGSWQDDTKNSRLTAPVKRPIIYAGGGVISSDASEELVSLAERMCMPVTTTLMGLGCIPTITA